MEMKRVLLKLSGEALAGDKKSGFDDETAKKVAVQVKEILDRGIQVSIVIGGGNFWRGRSSGNMADRVKADQIGMLATVMNCIYMSDILRQEGIKTHVMTPFICGNVTEVFSKDAADEYLNKGEVCFFAGGTGHPYFSTDTATVLMAIQTCSDAILMAKAIDGVYTSDPNKDPDAKKIDRMHISEIVDKKLGVIDLSAAVLGMENKMPMILFGLEGDNIIKNASGEITGTIVDID